MRFENVNSVKNKTKTGNINIERFEVSQSHVKELLLLLGKVLDIF